ncbi:MAG: YceI family protein [Burkholderiaceae bacterium]|nr:YceI family protein [Burkholderiaceae bacterium]
MRMSTYSTTLALVALFVAWPAQAQQKLVPAQSEIAFLTRQMGVPVEGRFRQFDAQVAFDPKQVAASKISFTIDLGSATIGTAETEAELLKPDWFDTRRFPKATFTSTQVKQVAAGKLEVAGTLSIKGSSQPVTVPVLLAPSGTFTTATGSFTLKRLDFKIGDGDWKDTSVVANEVQVRFKLTLAGVAGL